MIINNLHTVFQLEAQYSFLDYVMGGCQINFTVRSVMVQYLLLIAADVMNGYNACIKLTCKFEAVWSKL